MIWFLIAQFWLSLAAPGTTDLLYGNWQSCRDDEGYQERIVDFKRGQPGVSRPFELHMGPRDEFAIMAGCMRSIGRMRVLDGTGRCRSGRRGKPCMRRYRSCTFNWMSPAGEAHAMSVRVSLCG